MPAARPAAPPAQRGSGCGARAGGTLAWRGALWAQEWWGSLCARTVRRIGAGRRSSPSVRLQNLAVWSERAPPVERAAQSLSAAPSGFSPPAKSFVWKGTVSSAAVCLLLPPPLTALSSRPFSLLLGWVITGPSCQARCEELLPRFWVCGPSRQQTGRCPPTSRGPPAPALWRHLVARERCVGLFPSGQNFVRSFWVAFLSQS